MAHPTRLLLALAGAILLGLFSPANVVRAENPGPAALATPAADAPVAEREAYWHTRAGAARERAAAARERLESAAGDISRMRRRNHPRGAPRAALFGVRDAARIDLDDALRYLEVELTADARQAGALALWLRE